MFLTVRSVATSTFQPFTSQRTPQRIALFFATMILVFALVACGGSSSSSSSTPPTVTVSVSPTAVSVPVSQTTQFMALVSGSSNQAVTWQVNGVAGGDATHGTISTSGLYTAPATVPAPATETVTAASVANPSATTTVAVTVVAASAVSVSPSVATLGAGTTLAFTANVNGVPSTNITWSVVGGPVNGSITAAGVYTAPPTPPVGGTVTISGVDNGGAGTGSATLTIAFSSATLHGPYAFSFSGSNTSGFLAAAGSFTADGKGNITGGLEDINTAAAVSTNLTFTGTYTIGGDGRGTASLTFPGSNNATWQIAMINDQHALFIRFDTSVVTASGSIDRQDTTAFNNAAFNGGYVANLSGVDGSANPLVEVGEMQSNGSGAISSGVLDAVDGLNTFANQSFTGAGTYSVTSTGRGTLSFTTSSGGTQTFALYAVNASQFKLVETDASLAVAGDLNQQGSAVLNGKYAFTLAGSNSSGSSFVPFALGGILTANGIGSFTSGTFDENDAGGSVTTGFSLFGAGSYTVDAATGRITAVLPLNDDLSRTLNLALYPKANGSVAIIDIDTAVIVASGTAYAQQSGTVSQSSLNGSFALNWNGAAATTPVSEEDVSGLLAVSAGGTALNGTLDISLLSSLSGSTNSAVTVSGNLSLNNALANGYGSTTLTGGASFIHGFYVVDKNTVLILDNDSSAVLVGILKRQF